MPGIAQQQSCSRCSATARCRTTARHLARLRSLTLLLTTSSTLRLLSLPSPEHMPEPGSPAMTVGWRVPPQVASSARCSSRPRSRLTCSSLPPPRRRVSRRRYRNLRPRRWEPKGEGPCPHHLGTEALRHRALSAADTLLGPGPERCLGRFSSRPGRARRTACRATAPCSRCRPCASRATPAPATRLSAQARRRADVVNYWAADDQCGSFPGCPKVGSI